MACSYLKDCDGEWVFEIEEGCQDDPTISAIQNAAANDVQFSIGPEESVGGVICGKHN